MIKEFTAAIKQSCVGDDDPYIIVPFIAPDNTSQQDLAFMALYTAAQQYKDSTEVSVEDAELVAVTCDVPTRFTYHEDEPIAWSSAERLVVGDASAYDEFLTYRKEHPIYGPPIPDDEIPF